MRPVYGAAAHGSDASHPPERIDNAARTAPRGTARRSGRSAAILRFTVAPARLLAKRAGMGRIAQTGTPGPVVLSADASSDANNQRQQANPDAEVPHG